MLLASLLLGYGLDAWVCFGADAVGQQTWVLTRPSKDVALFWDPSSGKFLHMSTHSKRQQFNKAKISLDVKQDLQKSAVIKSDS
jgi:hypothetical protein